MAAALLAGASTRASAQMVMLRIQPRLGDTMYTRFEETVEMVGTRNIHSVDTTMTSRMDIMILSHSLVQASDKRGTTVLAITDSVAMQGHGTGATAPSDAIRHAMQGRQARLKIARDGSAELLAASDDVSPEVEALYSGMPATLPEKLVSVRSTWERTAYIPVSQESDTAHSARVRTTYRLDSLSSNGSLAYISIHGTISRDSAAALVSESLRVGSTGTVTGHMTMDRKRGWWVESEIAITIRSVVTRIVDPVSTMQVQTRILQSMQTRISP
ncbi:MAG: hypothetical protein JJD97_10785 [Gemmatimonadaceae bacterium]|nr:hypothetical protein [Gemmatimonadaceae bacterium]